MPGGAIRKIEILCADATERDDGMAMAMLAAVKELEVATERVCLLAGEWAKQRGVALLVE